jgi:hypothetical protein
MNLWRTIKNHQFTATDVERFNLEKLAWEYNIIRCRSHNIIIVFSPCSSHQPPPSSIFSNVSLKSHTSWWACLCRPCSLSNKRSLNTQRSDKFRIYVWRISLQHERSVIFWCFFGSEFAAALKKKGILDFCFFLPFLFPGFQVTTIERGGS